MYSFDGRVRYSECDHREKLRLPSLINYFQDCSTFQGEDIHQGIEDCRKRGRAWIICYWQVEIERFPSLGEQIRVGTFVSRYDKFFANRYFLMQGEEGLAARAYSLWVNMDVETWKPRRLTEQDVAGYEAGEPLDMKLEGRKIRLPKGLEFEKAGESLQVLRRHIDTNEHMNNGQYIEMAMEMLPRDLQVSGLRVEYKKSAKLGDWIYPLEARTEKGRLLLLGDEKGEPYTILEFAE